MPKVIRPAVRPAVRYPSRDALAPREGVGYPFVNSEARDIVARFTTPPTDVRKALIDAWWTAVKAGGVSAADLDWFYMLAAADSQAARQNWIADLYNATAVNSPSFVADRGYTGNGTSYLDTGFNPATAPSPKFTLNDSSLGIFHRTNVAETVRDIGNTNATLISRAVGDGLGGRSNNVATVFPALTVPTSVGQTSWSRTAVNAYQFRKNGADYAGVQVDATTAHANENMRVLNGVASGGTKQACAAWAGKSLTAAKDLAIYNANLTYLQAIGAM